MDPVTGIALASAIISGLKQLIPQIQEWKNQGLISAEDQQKISDEYKSLVRKADGQFSGPEWEKSGR